VSSRFHPFPPPAIPQAGNDNIFTYLPLSPGNTGRLQKICFPLILGGLAILLSPPYSKDSESTFIESSPSDPTPPPFLFLQRRIDVSFLFFPPATPAAHRDRTDRTGFPPGILTLSMMDCQYCAPLPPPEGYMGTFHSCFPSIQSERSGAGEAPFLLWQSVLTGYLAPPFTCPY